MRKGGYVPVGKILLTLEGDDDPTKMCRSYGKGNCGLSTIL
jgi:hypothetical protein